MLRRFMVGVALVLGLFVIAAFALVVFRIALAETLLSSQLASLGVPAARLTVASLDFHRLVVTDIALGDEAELHAESVTVTYRPGQILDGRLQQVAIDGLGIRLDLTGAGPLLGSLHALMPAKDAKEDRAAGAAPVPATVILSRGRIDAAIPSGDMAATVSGQWEPLAGTARLAVSDLALPHVALDTSRLEVDATPERIVVTAQTRGLQDAADLDLRATVESWRREPTLALDLDGRLAPTAWRISPLPSIKQGTMSVSLHMGGQLQPFEEMPADARALQWFLGADLGGWLGVSLADVAWSEWARGVSGTLNFALNVAFSGLEAFVNEGRIAIDRLDPAMLHETGLATIMPGLLDHGITADIAAGRTSLLRLRPTDDGAELAVSGNAEVATADSVLALRTAGALTLDKGLAAQRISLPNVEVRLHNLALAGGHRMRQLVVTGAVEGPPGDLSGTADLSAEMAATRLSDLMVGDSKLALSTEFRWAGRRLEMRQRGTGTASIASVAFGTQARIVKPLALRLTDGASTLAVTPDGLALSHGMTVRPDAVAVDLPRPGAAPLVLRAATGTIRLEGDLQPGVPYRGRLALGASGLAVPEQALAAEAITASLAFPAAPGEDLAQFSVGRLVHTAAPAYFAPLRIDGEVVRQNDAYVLTAAGTGASGTLRLTVRARHRIADGRGTLRLDLPEIAFRKDTAQPAHLSPLLRDIRDAAGRIGATAQFAWGPGGLESKGTMEFAELSFLAGDVIVTGLDSRISLDALLPPATPPGQTITVRQIDPALPLDDIVIRFQAEPAWPSRLRLGEARARFARGRLTVAPTVLDLSRSSHDLSLGVDGVDLGVLLGLFKLEDMSATGRLAGTIPIALIDGTVAIRDGQLAADGPGVVRVKSEAARAALGGAGESVALMLSALEDFRYDALSTTVNMRADGSIAVMVRMRGHNPAVLDGYPFAFNIGLDGNLADLLVALRQGARLSTDLIRPRLR